MVRSVSGSSRWGFPTSFSCNLQPLPGKRRITNLLHSGSFPSPSPLIWGDNQSPSLSLIFPPSHFSWFLVSPAPISAFFDVCLCSSVSWFLSSLLKCVSSQSQGVVLLRSAPDWAHPCSSSMCLQTGLSPQLLLSFSYPPVALFLLIPNSCSLALWVCVRFGTGFSNFYLLSKGHPSEQLTSSPSHCSQEERCSYHSISACFTCKSACLHFAFCK